QKLSSREDSLPPQFGVSTKSQLGVKSAGGLNSVKQHASEKTSKNEETAFACGILIGGLVPKGGLEPPRVTSHAPQTCASTSSATSARLERFSKIRVSAGPQLLLRGLRRTRDHRGKRCGRRPRCRRRRLRRGRGGRHLRNSRLQHRPRAANRR